MTEMLDRSSLSELLKPFISAVLNQYRFLQAMDVPSDAKGFTTHHMAGKAALSHLELLLKFVEAEKGDKEDEGLSALQAEAKEAFDGLGGYDDT